MADIVLHHYWESSYSEKIRRCLLQTRMTVLALITATTLACVPFVTTTYYRPEAPEGRIARAHCPSLPAFVLFDQDGIVVGARVSWWEEQMAITMTFEVSEGRTVNLLGGQVRIHSPGGVAASGELTGHMWVGLGATADFPPDFPLVGKTRRWRIGPFKQTTHYGTTKHAYFWFSAKVGIPESDRFTVALPAFTINGVESKLPEIEFRLSTQFHWIYPVNC